MVVQCDQWMVDVAVRQSRHGSAGRLRRRRRGCVRQHARRSSWPSNGRVRRCSAARTLFIWRDTGSVLTRMYALIGVDQKNVAVASHNAVAGVRNDLWMFNLTTGWWTWIQGSSGVNSAGVFGKMGVVSAANVPGARADHSMVIDSVGGVVYVFGGQKVLGLLL